jgi:mono/diheme cytochrome c family protein
MPRLVPAIFIALLIPAIAASQTVDFAKQIQPIFASRCYACHGPDKQKNGLRLDRAKDALTGGDSGAAIVPGNPAEGELLRRVTSRDKSERMPPVDKGEPLTPDQIQALRLWIEQGAKWPDDGKVADRRDWWSFKPIVRPRIPAGTSPAARNAIDAFVQAKLREKGLLPSPQADRRTLIRRLYFDLIGLPPTPEEIDAFSKDPDPLAYEKLVDRLLASPHYGERWARHWLDVVHYGDTHGYDKDKPRPNAWPYRDYVVRALNADKPYARFAQEQIAGDVLFPDTIDGITATGFIAAGPWDFIGHAEVAESKIDGQIARLLDRDDMVSNTFNTFLSLTVQCARCHNHKFDPVTQTDYYRLQAVFAALDRADRSFDADPAVARQRKALEARKKEAAANSPALAELNRELAKLPAPQFVYAGMVYHGSGAFSGSGGKPRPIQLLQRGDVRTPGPEVTPGTVPLLPNDDGSLHLPAEPSEGQRRAALARWITDPRQPLTWRSIVNRVWQYHFGRALVDSPNDFGHMGQMPSHPELLDWLAAEFRDTGGSLKSLHRLIVTSATYRQTSTIADSGLRIADSKDNPQSAIRNRQLVDANNVFLWRMSRRKLEAEAVRDSVLAVAGKLNPRMGGPGFQDFVIEKPEHSPHYQYDLHDPESPSTHRRSIYRFIVRSQPQPFMTTLDCADPSMSVDKRNETLTALQALALLNNRFMLTMSGHLATRAGDVRTAFRLAVGREPTPSEARELAEYANKHELANACRVILNLNEFVFVD